MALLWYFILVPLFVVVGESQETSPINQTDLQVAMSDMRSWSYHGFVILLKILNATHNSLHDSEITFLMPKDEELSKVALNLDHLEDFILSHSIPTGLMLSHLLHFPNGTLVPSRIPNRMLNITNSGRSGLFVNNARIVTPNVCLNSVIRCHGISAALTFDDVHSSLVTLHFSLLKPKLIDPVRAHVHRKGKTTTVQLKRKPAPHE